jgi:hypothetical protein
MVSNKPVLSNRAGRFLMLRKKQHHQPDFGNMECGLGSEPGSQNSLHGRKHQHSRDREHNGRGDDRPLQAPRQQAVEEKKRDEDS